MVSIKLLKKYKKYNKGDIIKVSNIEAEIITDENIGYVMNNKECIFDTEFGISKAFKKSPSN